MLTRILSGAVLVLCALFIVLFNASFPLILNIVIALICVGAVHELARAMGLDKRLTLFLPSALVAGLIPFTSVLHHAFLIAFCYLTVMFIAQLREHSHVTFQEISVLAGMSLLIPACMLMLVWLRDEAGAHGMFVVMMTVLAAWAADAGAYFAGVLFGKHKLCPNISPKKTVEGAAGGLIINTAAMLLCGVIYANCTGAAVQYLPLALMGVIGTPFSILGDLSFSLIKRSCHIKDFSHLIPGHGGVLDRFDSVLFVAPFVYFLTSYLPVIR